MTEQPPNYPPPPPGDYPPPGPGYPPPGPGYPPPGQPAAGTNTFAIVSLVASLVGWLCVGIGSILGVVFGFLALNQIKNTGEGGRGLAIAGIIIGILSIVGIIIYWIAAVVVAGSQPQVQTSSSAPPAVVLTVDQPVAAAFAA